MGKGKLILICQSGGRFVTNDDGSMTYTGGEAEAVGINGDTMFDDLKMKLAKLLNLDHKSLSLKYFLPGNKRILITMKHDKDLKRMYEFHANAVTAEVFVTGKEGFCPETTDLPGNRSSTIGVAETGITVMVSENVVDIPVQVEMSATAHDTTPRVTYPSDTLIDIPVIISTNPATPINPRPLRSYGMAKTTKTNNSVAKTKNSGTKSSTLMGKSIVCGIASNNGPVASGRSDTPSDTVKKRRRSATGQTGPHGPIVISPIENVRETRRRKSLRKNGQNEIVSFIADDDILQELDSEPEIDYSDANDRSVESLVASWKKAITGAGQEFKNVSEFRDALQKYAIAHRFGYKLKKNESNRATGVCVAEGCSWKIHASWVPSERVFRIKNMKKSHTCGGESWKHVNPTKNWLVSIIKEKLRDNPNQKTKDIANGILHDFGLEVNYCKLRRGIDEARGGLHGSFKEAYTHLPHFCDKILEANPGSSVKIVIRDDRRFQHLFISFHACIKGFQNGCRPLLFLDATPFKSKYHEVLLAATALDGDDGVFPVALAVVDIETDETWRWFLENLKSLMPNSPTITFVSDREKRLMKPVTEIFENAHHGYSIHYLMEDFMRNLRGPFHGEGKPSLPPNFLAAARADRLDGFKIFTEQIKRVSPKAYDWVMQIEPKHWTTALFEGEPYSHITCDVGEIYASWIGENQDLPIVQKLEALVRKITDLVNSRRNNSKVWSGKLVPSKEEKLQEESNRARGLKVFISSDILFEVHDDSVQVVDINKQTCSCFGWKPTGLPCRHAIAVLNSKGRSLYDYCSRYFSVESYCVTYSDSINPVWDVLKPTDEDEDEDEGEEVDRVLPPPACRPLVRRKKLQDRKRGRSVCCTRCGGIGHNKATCKDDL